jgi:hypothetical protein
MSGQHRAFVSILTINDRIIERIMAKRDELEGKGEQRAGRMSSNGRFKLL